ncbi:MAG: TonB-dependent receptor [Sphingopyxis sp.]
MRPLSPLFSLACSVIALSVATLSSAQTRATPPVTDDDYHTADEDLVVTAPFVRSLDLFGNVGVVEGDDLAQQLRPQIGDTLAREPGVSATSFAPGVSRPVLRGFQGERVRVLVDGIGSIDASNTSADHAVAIDPLTAERIEILRGPASLLFGSSAIGGAVNIFDRRIPRSMPEAPLHVDILANYGSAADERSGGASLDVPLGSRVAFHVDGAYSKANDLRIGGFQSTPALRAAGLAIAADLRADGDIAGADAVTAAANHRGTIENSATRTYSFGSGVSLITDGGSLGVSIGYLDSIYGLPGFPGGESGVTIALEQWRADFRGEVEFGGGFIDRLRIRGGFADYSHAEREADGAIGTLFLNQGIEARAELVQQERGGWSGASGVQYAFRDFNAIGAEAFLPQNDSEQFALFTLQDLRFGAFGVQLSGRYEHASAVARSIDVSRNFDAFSGAAGLSYEFGDNSKVGINLSRTSRAPSAEELFSNGPHLATQSFEVGNVNFGKESAWSVEGYARLRSGPVAIEAALYSSWFDNFIFATATGAIEDGLSVFEYRQRDARYYGAELQASAELMQFGGFTLVGDVVADIVRARLSGGGGNIPRIPPLRLRGGLELGSDTLTLRGEVEWSAAQNRVASFETATQAFTIANVSAQWKPLGADGGVTLIVSGNNLFDVLGRRHASFTKDFAPLSGRDVRVTARLSF